MRYLPFSCITLILFACVAAADSIHADTSGERLPAYFIELPDSVSTVLIAETEAATMHRFTVQTDRVVENDRRYMSIGTAGAGKQRAWDKKTPLGVYFITDSLDTSKLHEKYGIAAYPLDYPNAWDRLNERTGDGIWLHGVDKNNPERPPLDTDGCLALPNEELLRLTDTIEPLVTPVIVARELQWAMPEDIETLRLEFRVAVDLWRSSLAAGDLKTYLELYAKDFHYRGMDHDDWAAWRYSVFAAREFSDVSLSDMLLIADPEVENLYLSRFTQTLATTAGPVTTTKRLYWRRSGGNQWQIVSEDAG